MATAPFAGTGGADVDGTADQTNYLDSDMRVNLDNMENVIATGLGAVELRLLVQTIRT